MARHNPYIRPRPKISKVKESGFIKEEEKIATALAFIKTNGTVSDFQIRHVMKSSYSLHERMMANLNHNYQEYVSHDKKARTYTHLKERITEKETEIKEKITDNDYKIMQAMKQEVKQ